MPCSAPAAHERVPEVLAVRGGAVDLVAQLADEADPQDQARHAGDLRALAVEVGEALGRQSSSVSPARISRARGPARLTADERLA